MIQDFIIKAILKMVIMNNLHFEEFAINLFHIYYEFILESIYLLKIVTFFYVLKILIVYL